MLKGIFLGIAALGARLVAFAGAPRPVTLGPVAAGTAEIGAGVGVAPAGIRPVALASIAAGAEEVWAVTAAGSGW